MKTMCKLIQRRNLPSRFGALKKMSLLILTFSTLLAFGQSQVNTQQKKKPNILLIVADDMGYSDLGCYGGEINTPVINKISEEGLRFTNFYVSPTCSVTRSMLLSGTDNHIAGLGNMGCAKPGRTTWLRRSA